MLNDSSHLQKQVRDDMMNVTQGNNLMHVGNNQRMARLNIDPHHFEPVGLDPLQFPDYSSQLLPSMDSPNIDNAYQVQIFSQLY